MDLYQENSQTWDELLQSIMDDSTLMWNKNEVTCV
jgi:hypothetical protein